MVKNRGKGNNILGILVTLTLYIRFKEDKDGCVASCESLKIKARGDDIEDSFSEIKDAIGLFVEGHLASKTLDKILHKRGFQLIPEKPNDDEFIKRLELSLNEKEEEFEVVCAE